jgi:hypothetical protein
MAEQVTKVWKVIDKDRYSIYADRSPMDNNRNSKYRKHYEPMTVVRSTKGSLGIFCFKTKEKADHFINTHILKRDAKIIPVLGIGQPRPVPSSIFCNNGLKYAYYAVTKRNLPLIDYLNFERYAYTETPSGTILFDRIVVLK